MEQENYGVWFLDTVLSHTLKDIYNWDHNLDNRHSEMQNGLEEISVNFI